MPENHANWMRRARWMSALAVGAGCATACVNDAARLAVPEDPCPPGLTLCDEACVDTNLNPGHCGACGQTCGSGELCSIGQCGTECLGGTTQCGQLCVDINVDPQNCGGCDMPCGGGEQCTNATCTSVCGGGDKYCVDACVDVSSDNQHCGDCNQPCSASQQCVSGSCVDSTSCLAIKTGDPGAVDGVYLIDPDGGGALPPVSTYCDMTTDGGGWTLLGKTTVAGLTAEEMMTLRESYWADYTDLGYGDPAPSSRLYWMALKYWRELTTVHPSNEFWQKSDAASMVRVVNLSIADSSNAFAWSWTGPSSGFLDIVPALKNMKFTARDADNDTWPNNCAVDNIGLNGGFWYQACYQLSMLHVSGNVYRLDGNAATAVGFSELYLR